MQRHGGRVSPRRPGTRDDRDEYRPKHDGGVVESAWEDATSRYEGEELAQARAKRPTAERLARLEIKHDALDKAVGDIAVTVGRSDVKLDTLIKAHEKREQDEADAKKFRRQLMLKIAGGVFSGAVIGKVLSLAGVW